MFSFTTVQQQEITAILSAITADTVSEGARALNSFFRAHCPYLGAVAGDVTEGQHLIILISPMVYGSQTVSIPFNQMLCSHIERAAQMLYLSNDALTQVYRDQQNEINRLMDGVFTGDTVKEYKDVFKKVHVLMNRNVNLAMYMGTQSLLSAGDASAPPASSSALSSRMTH